MSSADYIRDLLSMQTSGRFIPEEEDLQRAGGRSKLTVDEPYGGKFTADFRDDPHLASIVCPTGTDRHSFHPFLYHCFCRQSHMPCEMIVVDVGIAASRFFTSGPAASDPRVIYRFFEIAETDEPWSIGTKRNIACCLASGEVIVHFDDDDIYTEEYVEWMLQALRHGSVSCDTAVSLYQEADAASLPCKQWGSFAAGAATLSCWWTYALAVPTFTFCDPEFDEHLSAPDRRQFIFGYGFSFVYLRALWCLHPFQDISLGEDYFFMNSLISEGWSIALARDTIGFCAHTHHQGNVSGWERTTRLSVDWTRTPLGVSSTALVGASCALRKFHAASTLEGYSVERSLQSLMALKTDCIGLFATAGFQKELKDVSKSARSQPKKEGAIQFVWMNAMRNVVPKYGFEATLRGVGQSLSAWPEKMLNDPEVAMQTKLCAFLLVQDQKQDVLEGIVPGLTQTLDPADNLEIMMTKALRHSGLLARKERGPISRLSCTAE